MIKVLKSIYRRAEFFKDNFFLNRKFRAKAFPFFEEVDNKYSITSSLPKILWIGANSDQDQIGFISELNSISELTLFKNIKGENQVLIHKNDKEKTINLNTSSLIEIIKNNDFDIIMGQIWPELIDFQDIELQKLIKEKKIKSICICMDDFMPERWKTNNLGKMNGPAGFGTAIDLYATSDLISISKYSKLGLKSVYLPFGCSKNLKLKVEKDIDISFIGSNYGVRKDYINYLEARGLKISVFGWGFQSGHQNASEVISIYNRSKIVIGLSQVGYQTQHTNLKTRDFDVISTGTFYLSNSTYELNAFFTPGIHYVKFIDKGDLYDKANYYLKNSSERERIALNGYNQGKNFLWRDNLKYVLSQLELV